MDAEWPRFTEGSSVRSTTAWSARTHAVRLEVRSATAALKITPKCDNVQTREGVIVQ